MDFKDSYTVMGVGDTFDRQMFARWLSENHDDEFMRSLVRTVLAQPQPMPVSEKSDAEIILEHFGNQQLRMITFTQPDTMKDPYDLRTALQKFTSQSTYGVDKYYAVLELTKTDTPHIHCLFTCTKYLNQSQIKRIWKHGFKLETVRQPLDAVDYVCKSLADRNVQLFCRLKGISQVEYNLWPRNVYVHDPLENLGFENSIGELERNETQ